MRRKLLTAAIIGSILGYLTFAVAVAVINLDAFVAALLGFTMTQIILWMSLLH